MHLDLPDELELASKSVLMLWFQLSKLLRLAACAMCSDMTDPPLHQGS